MTQTINLEESKRLSRILAGKEKPENKLEKKLFEIQAKYNPKNENREFLFFYSVWTFIQNKQYKTLTESEAAADLKQFPGMEIYYCRLEGSPDNPPAILKGKKINKEIVAFHLGLSDLIYQKTGVRIPETDLMLKQKNEGPFHVKVQMLMKGIEEREKHDAEIQRIIKCLKENDPRKRTDCLNNCNI